MEQLKKILCEQLAWYKEAKAKEESGEVDSSYIYDTACDQFDNLSRGAFAEILEILSK